MMTTKKALLEFRCWQRCYTLEEVAACIISQDGDDIVIDVDSPAYPRHPKPGCIPEDAKFPAALRPVEPAGPGTELKKLLKTWLRIEATPTCSCNARAAVMDQMEAREPGWCEAHLDEIVGWLREEATKRGLPFLDAAGRVLVKRAISNARKAEARRAKEAAQGEDAAV